MPAITSSASAISGPHIGLTKLVTSISRRPASWRACASSILSRAETGSFSFCRPSRGATSTIFTNSGRAVIASLQGQQFAAFADLVARREQQLGDGAVARRGDGVFHFHRFEYRQRLSGLDRVAH